MSTKIENSYVKKMQILDLVDYWTGTFTVYVYFNMEMLQIPVRIYDLTHSFSARHFVYKFIVVYLLLIIVY